MANKKINKISPGTRVLVAPLDWGLGHATRCIPLINELITGGCEVIIAAENAVKSLLQREFQQLTFIPLKGYRISYAANGKWLPVKMALQAPRILLTVYQEHIWLKKVVKKYSINAVISDNRFGLYHPQIPCIYLTHQLLIKTNGSFTEKMLRKLHFGFIKRFTGCWVPDFEGQNNIAGELSHPLELPANTSYIGCLSRFEKNEAPEKNYDLLVLISGPEPQRSAFEELMLEQIKNYNGSVLLVRGLPGMAEGSQSLKSAGKNLRLVTRNHLSAKELNDAIQQAELVICRSGYTTIMDLVKLQQKAVLVPTPGQTEQEYLGWHLAKQDMFYAVSQEGFSLADVLAQVGDFPFKFPAFDMEQYKRTVAEFVQSLKI